MAMTKRAPKEKPVKRVDRRKTISTRITPETRAKLEATVAQSGRSLAQEIELRLQQSFLDEEARHRELGGRELHSLFRMMGAAAQIIEERKGQSCTTDFETFVAVKASWLQLMSSFSPRPRQRGSKYIESIGGPPLDFVLPPDPTPPAYPAPINALIRDYKPSAEETAAYEKKQAAYKKAKAKRDKAVDELQDMAKAVGQHFEALKDLGKEVAVGLFPPRKRG